MQDNSIPAGEDHRSEPRKKPNRSEKADPDDWRLLYMAPGDLESMRNGQMLSSCPPGEYHRRGNYEFPMDLIIDFNKTPLTNKQMIAVSLVYFSGIGKMRASRVMNISHQALNYHLKAAAKKLKKFLARYQEKLNF
ncbi:hypothetical protein UR09_03065 [Candidatus Nitromaritima sp. SCGC AAA799-A02]|nr:hypothetical protein UZ36_06675 [Candidatus Nitromaritima sp. SCGC AAA799-C22]KMP11533.1 hypothetical protein UR09_03065 [Candidatus Nitromaritima sp. SCGC AAA799-A02]